MTYTTSHFRLGPEFTPSVIKTLILWICLSTIGCALVNNIFIYVFGIPGPQEWFSLSWWGMQHYLFWQPITCLFVQYTGYQGITFFFLLLLAFNLYLLWIMGADVLRRVGKAPFLRFFFICGGGASLSALLLMPLTGQYGVLSGATPSIIALLVVWTLMHPDAELLLFFLIPVKARWLTFGMIGVVLLISLSQLNIVNFSYYFFGAIAGYFYGLIAWGLHSPFLFLYRMEWALMRYTAKIHQLTGSLFSSQKKKKARSGKIFTLKPESDDTLNDDQFIDAMLEKISKYGEQALTWKEKERMEAISKKRRQK